MYHISREDVNRLLDSSFSSFLNDVTEYVRITATEETRGKPEYMYRDAAREIIYQQCLLHFRHNEYVTDAYDALDKVARGSYGDWIRSEIRKANQSAALRAERKKAEEKRIADLKKECEERGLNFEEENEKYLKAIAKKKNLRQWATMGVVGLFCPPLLIVALVGFLVELFKRPK